MRKEWKRFQVNIEFLVQETFGICFILILRPEKEKAIVLETDFKIYKRLWPTPEKSTEAFNAIKKGISKNSSKSGPMWNKFREIL